MQVSVSKFKSDRSVELLRTAIFKSVITDRQKSMWCDMRHVWEFSLQ